MRKHAFEGVTVWCAHKGGNSQNEMNRANQISSQQLAMQQQELGLQQQQLGMVNPSLQQIIANGGMLPQQQAAMTSLAMNSLPQTYGNAVGAINNELVARGVTGGGMAGGGSIARDYGQLYSQMGNQQQNMLENIQIAKGQGLETALNTALGIGGMYGQQATSFGNQGVGALGAGVTAANNADQAQTGFWGSLIGGLAGMGGNVFQGKFGG